MRIATTTLTVRTKGKRSKTNCCIQQNPSRWQCFSVVLIMTMIIIDVADPREAADEESAVVRETKVVLSGSGSFKRLGLLPVIPSVYVFFL